SFFVLLAAQAYGTPFHDHGLVVGHAGGYPARDCHVVPRYGDRVGLLGTEVGLAWWRALKREESKKQVVEFVKREPRVAGRMVPADRRGQARRRSIAREA